MRTRIVSLLSMFTALTISAGVSNAQVISIGEPTYGGSGCPDGTVTSVFSPDEGTLSLLFDEYVVESAKGDSNERRACSLSVPVKTAPGFRIQMITIDYRGYMESPFWGWIYFLAKYKVNGKDAIDPILKAWPHSFSEDFLVQHSITGPKPWERFPCGGEFELGTKTEVEAKKWLPWVGTALFALDSADLAPNMEIGLSVLPCDE